MKVSAYGVLIVLYEVAAWVTSTAAASKVISGVDSDTFSAGMTISHFLLAFFPAYLPQARKRLPKFCPVGHLGLEGSEVVTRVIRAVAAKVDSFLYRTVDLVTGGAVVAASIGAAAIADDVRLAAH